MLCTDSENSSSVTFCGAERRPVEGFSWTCLLSGFADPPKESALDHRPPSQSQSSRMTTGKAFLLAVALLLGCSLCTAQWAGSATTQPQQIIEPNPNSCECSGESSRSVTNFWCPPSFSLLVKMLIAGQQLFYCTA